VRVALVSGGGRGLGAAIAGRLLADGYAVSIGARRPEAAAEAFANAPRERFHAARFDADAAETAADWVAAAHDRFGRIDALVNNAGILRMVDFERGDEDDLDAMWRVNAKAPFRLVRAALPHLRASGRGRIVNIASTDGKRYRDTTTSLGYVMTKHALVAMTHAARFAGWADGVRATAICPGAIETDMIAGLAGATPPGQRLSAETVADVVAFVLSLPNEASVPELVANTRLESTL
jgi:NAD(P)-dependent dehydrogenase (short-subunit alcohol dehydrogenase family)